MRCEERNNTEITMARAQKLTSLPQRSASERLTFHHVSVWIFIQIVIFHKVVIMNE